MFDSSAQLIFANSVTYDCFDVVVVNDSDVEGDQEFELAITDTTLGTVLFPSSITTITITDNLGKSLLNNCEIVHPLNCLYRWCSVTDHSVRIC